MSQPDKHDKKPLAQRCTDIPWTCGACGTLLGFVDKETREQVRIKRQDLMVWVTDPEKLEVACTSCCCVNVATSNVIHSEAREVAKLVRRLERLAVAAAPDSESRAAAYRAIADGLRPLESAMR